MKKRNWSFKNSPWYLLIPALLAVFFIGCWISNLVKFVKCDFSAPYKTELIHGLGVFVPPTAVITVWMD